jgi:hypothetical protein
MRRERKEREKEEREKKRKEKSVRSDKEKQGGGLHAYKKGE